MSSRARTDLCGCWVGSLDFNFWIPLIFPFNQQKVKLFAGIYSTRGNTHTHTHIFWGFPIWRQTCIASTCHVHVGADDMAL